MEKELLNIFEKNGIFLIIVIMMRSWFWTH